MDGFAGPGGADAAYGAADRALPDLPSPNPAWSAAEWREVLARLPLVPASRLLAVENAAAGATLRLAAAPPSFVSRITGRYMFYGRSGSLAGQQVMWEMADADTLGGLDFSVNVGTGTGRPRWTVHVQRPAVAR
jgi:hypothetical protein